MTAANVHARFCLPLSNPLLPFPLLRFMPSIEVPLGLRRPVGRQMVSRSVTQKKFHIPFDGILVGGGGSD